MNIAIIGATGDMGYGLALRLARLGHRICIGSRQLEKAEEAAGRAREESGVENITGLDNPAACAGQDLIIISVPAAGHRPTLETLKDHIGNTPVLDVTIPMAFGPLRYDPPAEGSNALEVAGILGEEAKVTCGFHTISASLLCEVDKPLTGDLLVAGSDKETIELVVGLGEAMGLRAFNAGGLVHSPTLEALTPLLISMGKRYKQGHLGIGLSGI